MISIALATTMASLESNQLSTFWVVELRSRFAVVMGDKASAKAKRFELDDRREGKGM
jgi:hypothetical protein